MTDTEATENAIEAFNNLSDGDISRLKNLNTKIQSHKGKWGTRRGGEEIAKGTIEMPWTESDPLIYEFMDFMYEKDLPIAFNWTGRDEVSELFTSEDQTKYDNVDLETALKLIYVASRKERFASGTLAWAFESGGFPKLIDRLVGLKEQ